MWHWSHEATPKVWPPREIFRFQTKTSLGRFRGLYQQVAPETLQHDAQGPKKATKPGKTGLIRLCAVPCEVAKLPDKDSNLGQSG